MIELIISAMQKQENFVYAEKMSAYMRHKFDFYGLMATERKSIQREIFLLLKKEIQNADRWYLVRELWEKPQRECMYFAIDWINTFPKKTYAITDIRELKFLLLNQSWWDSVDSIASNILGKYNLQFPENQIYWLNEWRESENIWLRRSCIIFQLKYKNNTDWELLKEIIIENKHDNEFFIQKAIGWSLRQYAKFQPEFVKEFVENQNIVGLARREALKHFN